MKPYAKLNQLTKIYGICPYCKGTKYTTAINNKKGVAETHYICCGVIEREGGVILDLPEM